MTTEDPGSDGAATRPHETPRVLVFFDYACPFCYLDWPRFKRLRASREAELVLVPGMGDGVQAIKAGSLKAFCLSVHGGDGGIAVQRASYGLGLIADEILVGIIAAFNDLIIFAVVVSPDPGPADHL